MQIYVPAQQIVSTYMVLVASKKTQSDYKLDIVNIAEIRTGGLSNASRSNNQTGQILHNFALK